MSGTIRALFKNVVTYLYCMRLTVGLPVYNEAENIPRLPSELLPTLRGLGVTFEILLVDDGSADGSAAIAEGLGIPELRVVRHQKNRGLGAAIRTLFAEARGELLVTLDTDLTFAPSDIPLLLQRYEKGDVDFVIGSHGLAGYSADIPRWRVVISKMANSFYSVLAGQWVRGVSSLFRLYRTEIVRSLPVVTSGYETLVEVFFRLVAAQYRFAEVPTPLGNREYGRSKLNYRREIVRHLRLVKKIVFGRMEPRSAQPTMRWRAGVVAACALAVVSFLPQIIIPLTWKSAGLSLADYHPLSLAAPNFDEVASYGARIREVMDGHWRDGDAYVAEYKNQTSLWGNHTLGIVLALPLIFFSASDPTPLFVFGKFFFPILILISLFGFLRRFDRAPWMVAAMSFMVVAFPNISVLRQVIRLRSLDGLWRLVANLFDPGITRIAVPSPGLAVFFAFLWAWVSLLERGWRIGAVLIAGLLLGCSAYVYFFYGVFAWCVALLTFAGALVFRRFDFARRAGGSMLVGAVLTIPYALHLLATRSLPNVLELQQRIGAQLGHNIIWSPVSFVLVLVLIPSVWWLGSRMARRRQAAFIILLLVATVVVQNIQVVTGMTIQPDHWGSRVNVYVYALALWISAVWGLRLFRVSGRTIQFAGILILCTAVGLGATIRIVHSHTTAFDYVFPRDMQDAMHWINTQTPRDSVVASIAPLTLIAVPFFTHANSYLPVSCFTLASTTEVIERWEELTRLFGMPEDLFVASAGDADVLVNPARGRIMDPNLILFCDQYSYLQENPYIGGDSRRTMPPEVLANLRTHLRAVSESPPPDRFMVSHRVDYVFYGPMERYMSTRDPSRYENLHLVYQNASVRIYQVEK